MTKSIFKKYLYGVIPKGQPLQQVRLTHKLLCYNHIDEGHNIILIAGKCVVFWS